MILMIPMVFIFLILVWFLIMGIMDKNPKMIIRFGIITFLYAVIVGGGFLLLYLFVIRQFQ